MKFMESRPGLIVFLLILLLLIQGIFSMRLKSGTYDEPNHLVRGYVPYKTGNFHFNISHPPLINLLSGLPLLFVPNLELDTNHPYYVEEELLRFAHGFVYYNIRSAEEILFWGRVPILLLSAFLGLFVFKWARELYGVKAGLFALLLYSFSPNILAHSRLATTDLGVTVFLFLATYQFWKFIHYSGRRNLILAGLTLGLALASKFSSLILFPIYFLFLLLYVLCHLQENSPGSFPYKSAIKLFASLFPISIIGFAILSACYGFFSVDNFFKGLGSVGRLSAGGVGSFLAGKYSERGWWYYFPVAFSIKTPIPTLIFIIMGILSLKKKRFHKDAFLLIPVAVVFGGAMFSHMNIGLRHILPIYPFLFVFSSRIVNLRFRKIILLLSLLYLFSSLRIFPHYLAYFNEFIGGPKNGYRWLVDSNLDWGQDLKALKKYLERRKVDEIILSYFGSASPEYYGIRYQYLPSIGAGQSKGYTISSEAHPELLAISATTLQGTHFSDHTLYHWLKEYQPVERIGHSIFIYDITNDSLAHRRLADIYSRFNLLPEASWAFKRAAELDEGNEERSDEFS